MKQFHLLALSVLIYASAFSQVSFSPVDTLSFYSDFGTYQSGNVYPIDFNKDGFDDLLFVKGNSVYVSLNSGSNSFGDEFLVYKHTNHIYSISNFIDINNDTYPDLAISDSQGIYLLSYSNNKFVKVRQSSDVIYYGKLILLDYDKDGKMDLTFSNMSSILIYGNVANSMTSKNTLYTDSDGAIFNYDIRNLNGDNVWDLVVSIYTKSLKVLFGNANGTFASIFSKATPNHAFFELGDLNLDGFLDITYQEWNNNLFTVIYNSATTSYTDQAVFANGSVPGNFNNFKLIDLKHNGTLDLVYNNFFTLTYRENNGLGQFQSPTALFENPFSPLNLNVFNLNNDDYDDLLTCDNNKFQIVKFISDGSSDFRLADGYYNDFWDVLYRDMDGDGFHDIVSFSRSGAVIIRWGNSGHTYTTVTKHKIPVNAYYGAIADVNADGKLDILITMESNSNSVNKVIVIEGQGSRVFGQAHDWKFFPSPGKSQVLDIRNDGKKYFISFQRYGSELAWLDVAETNFNEYYVANNKKSIAGNGINSVSYVDINDDEFVDLLTANTFSKNVSILKNNQAGNFNETVLTPNGPVTDVTGVNAFDYNHDQHLDLMVLVQTGPGDFALQIFLNDQLGNFSYHTTRSLIDMYMPRYIDGLDIDGDQKLDFIVSGWDYTTTNIFLNENDQFTNKGSLSIKNMGQASRIFTDLNGDSKPDVFTAGFHQGNTFIQLNNSVIQPALVETEITVEEIKAKSVKIGFSPTASTGRLVVITKGTEFVGAPNDNVFYTSNLQYGVGSSLGSNSHVVHVGTASSIEIMGLSSSTAYLISVFEYSANLPQFTIINYTTTKKTKAFTTLNIPPLITAIADQSGLNLEKISVPLTITDEDNLINEFEYSFTSSNPTVVPVSNLSVVLSSGNPTLEILPISEGVSTIEVTVIDTASNSATSGFQFNSVVVGITEGMSSVFLVFPSPFTNQVEIKHPEPWTESLVIYNSMGGVVKRFDNIPESVDCSDLTGGIYFFKSSDGECVKAVKL